MNIQYIESVICAEERMSTEELHMRTRMRNICEVRNIVMFLALHYGNTESYVARHFGLDHATAHHAKKAIMDLCDVYKEMKAKIDRYKILLKEEKVFYPIEQ